MSFTKITNLQLNSRGATTLPNQPTISPTALKEEFDAPAKNIVAPAVNNLIDELQAVTSAASLGAVAPTGRTGATVQALLTDISDDLAVVEGSSHSHTNKAQLDKISEDGSGNPLYDGNPIGAGAAWGDITGTLSNQTDLQTALNGKANSSHTHTKSQITDFPSLATVATSGSYNDLSNKPTIPDELNDLNDVVIASTPNNGDVLTYDNVAAKFKPQAPASGTVNNAYKNIVSAGQTFTASGEDTFKINAGSNVTITALSSPDKGIQISATGGGSSTGDMLMSDYDSTGDVKTAGGIKSFVADEIAKLDGTVSGTPGAGATLTAFSETDGKVSATFGAISITKSQVSDFPSLATVATSGSYSDLSNKPTIPNAANDATLTIQQNGTTKGTFTADANTNATANIVTDHWHGTSGTVSSGSVTFSGVDDSDNNGYELFVTVTSSSTNKNPTAQISSISGEGTSSMSIAFTTDADNGATCKLRIIK